MTMRGSAIGRYRSAGRRRRLGLIALALWVLGFEVIPNLHVALHDRLAAHHHDGDDADPADGLRVRVRYAGHLHEDGTWHDAGAGDDTGHAALGHAALGHAALGHAALGHAALGRAALGHAARTTTHTRKPPRPGIGPLPSRTTGHGRHSLAHRGLATPTPAPVVTAPLPVTRSVSWIEIDRVRVPPSRTATVAVARGPPEGHAA